mmetsp:Transcript_23587/g.36969  ORF Transcript_23587/g.36969 Transcript_23587/m.36969 type:complete len:200 (+) Transcript_23587:626-1225(+)
MYPLRFCCGPRILLLCPQVLLDAFVLCLFRTTIRWYMIGLLGSHCLQNFGKFLIRRIATIFRLIIHQSIELGFTDTIFGIASALLTQRLVLPFPIFLAAIEASFLGKFMKLVNLQTSISVNIKKLKSCKFQIFSCLCASRALLGYSFCLTRTCFKVRCNMILFADTLSEHCTQFIIRAIASVIRIIIHHGVKIGVGKPC